MLLPLLPTDCDAQQHKKRQHTVSQSVLSQADSLSLSGFESYPSLSDCASRQWYAMNTARYNILKPVTNAILLTQKQLPHKQLMASARTTTTTTTNISLAANSDSDFHHPTRHANCALQSNERALVGQLIAMAQSLRARCSSLEQDRPMKLCNVRPISIVVVVVFIQVLDAGKFSSLRIPDDRKSCCLLALS